MKHLFPSELPATCDAKAGLSLCGGPALHSALTPEAVTYLPAYLELTSWSPTFGSHSLQSTGRARKSASGPSFCPIR